jgi:hypothetical protein
LSDETTSQAREAIRHADWRDLDRLRRDRTGNKEPWFKIDYYNLIIDGASEDPADPRKTKRIMTIGSAEDR